MLLLRGGGHLNANAWHCDSKVLIKLMCPPVFSAGSSGEWKDAGQLDYTRSCSHQVLFGCKAKLLQRQQNGKFSLFRHGGVLREDCAVRGSQNPGFLHRLDHVQELGAERERGGTFRGEKTARALLPNPLHDPATALQLRPPSQGADELFGAVESQF